MPQGRPDPPRGRGASLAPANRFEKFHTEPDFEQIEALDDQDSLEPRPTTEFLPDHSASILSENDSPDIPFRYSINPYRGCEHGCSYCYARPSHEYLGFNAGIDFESRIVVKHEAPQLLRRELNRSRWRPESITLSGNTDCYQPAERKFRLTRGLIEVLHEAQHPFEIITKNALVLRDLDLLAPLAARRLTRVNISITTLDPQLARTLEPRTSAPAARLRGVRELAAAGVQVRVMVAPVIPGLNDHEIGQILAAAKEAGAVHAGYVLLRLPHALAPLFLDWLSVHRPLAREKVEGLVRETRGGELNRSTWHERQRGTGPYAEGIAAMFRACAKKLGLCGALVPLDTTQFRPPRDTGGQRTLF
jgi:DNA repair photolyase